MPQATRLTGVWPNPFNPQTTVAFDLAREGRARLLVYDLQGRLVSRLVDASLPAGHHSVVWQGRDESGRSVSSGIYFACLEVDGVKQLSKLTLVK